MLIQLWNGEIIGASITTDHAASSHGQPVLVLEDGSALGPSDAEGLGIIEATLEELRDLAAGGYSLQGDEG